MGPESDPPSLSPVSAAPLLDAQAIRDGEHLNLLAVFHFISAGLALLALGFIGLHFLIFNAVFSHHHFGGGFSANQDFPVAVLWVLYGGFGFWIASAGVLNLLSGCFLLRRRHRIFSIVVAAFNCLQVPFGTVLGVFTIVVLTRDSVRRDFLRPL
jgi:hypothetical protein